MAHSFDLDAYLERVAYHGPANPDYATLSGLLMSHMNHIHFENIDVLLGRPIRLDLASLGEKIVRGRRGGYCFEQATLFLAALNALGFDATPHTARVTLVLKPHEAPRGHMYIRVRLPEGDFIADPGLGGVGCRAPIPLNGAPVQEGNESYSFASNERCLTLKIDSPDRKINAWIAGFDEDNWVDFEVANHWVATHAASPFVNRLMMRAMIPGGRVTVMNRDVTLRRGDKIETLQLESRSELRRLVQTHFGFDYAEIDHIRIPSLGDWA
ncbi:arylamine N-acetyltransferase family protein [Methylovirgula sp. 4M-Z18]|uniref:arylamine N-acetyltransferase family protein n=1 Tax=Methylovirgula sp. 4M-Z18 TaxID=2293567 RepID=UPI000E2F3FA7|nr:arylamine N-acetyltransferase [Methylovirgula sp. 4M-Z18]RFB76341.1 arylamine N-acetyltransferase [Methylovirgula sp. 4M-Z18]